MSQLIVNFGGTILNDTVDYDIYKILTDMVPEGIQSEDFCKIRSGPGDKKDRGVDAETKLEKIYSKKYRINLDQQILY